MEIIDFQGLSHETNFLSLSETKLTSIALMQTISATFFYCKMMNGAGAVALIVFGHLG
jgi:hypothetical protein